MSGSGNSQALNKRDTYLAAIAIASGFLFLGAWYWVPGLLTVPLWDGASLTLAFALGSLSLLVPVLVAWVIVAPDKPATAEDTFETSDH